MKPLLTMVALMLAGATVVWVLQFRPLSEARPDKVERQLRGGPYRDFDPNRHYSIFDNPTTERRLMELEQAAARQREQERELRSRLR